MDTMLGTRVASGHVAYNDVVSQENQLRLIEWREYFKIGQFSIGDIAIEEITNNSKRLQRVPHDFVFKAIGSFCDKSGRTIRYYYENALFYPTDVREEFEMLPFSHFDFARYLGQTWREALEWSSLHPNASLALLRYQFLPPFGGCAENDNFPDGMDFSDSDPRELKRENGGNPQSDTCETSQYSPLVTAHADLLLLDEFLNHADQVESIVRASGLQRDEKADCLEAMGTLKLHLPKIFRNML